MNIALSACSIMFQGLLVSAYMLQVLLCSDLMSEQFKAEVTVPSTF